MFPDQPPRATWRMYPRRRYPPLLNTPSGQACEKGGTAFHARRTWTVSGFKRIAYYSPSGPEYLTVTIADQLDALMENQQRTIRWYVWFATSLVTLGMIVVAGMVFFSHWLGSDPIKTVLGIGGALVSTVGVFPLKEVNGCRDRLLLYRKLKTEVVSGKDVDQSKIESLVWDVVRKVALG
jgi:hypothetical protein